MSNRILVDSSFPFSFKYFIFSCCKLPSLVFPFYAQLSCPNKMPFFFVSLLYDCPLTLWETILSKTWWGTISKYFLFKFPFIPSCIKKCDGSDVKLTHHHALWGRRKFSPLVLPEAGGCSSSLCLKFFVFTFFKFYFLKTFNFVLGSRQLTLLW